MPALSDQQVSYIRQDLQFRGIVLDGIEDEVLDHICSSVETEIGTGTRFIDAYEKVLRSFGREKGLRQLQQSTITDQNPRAVMMLQHFITIALRNIRNRALFTFVNVTGLALGAAAFFLIYLLIANETSYDRYHEHAKEIVRLTSDVVYNGNVTHSSNTPAPAAKTLVLEFPEVELAANIGGQGLYFTKRPGRDNIKVERCSAAGSDLFKILSIPFITGNPQTALQEPNTVVINETTAKALFGNEDPLNQTIITDNWHNMTIVGVFKDFPPTSHLQMNMFVSQAGDEWYNSNSWVVENLTPQNPVKTYVLLKKGTDPKTFESKLDGLVQKYIQPSALSDRNATGNTVPDRISYRIQPFTSIHLDARFPDDFTPAFDISYVYMLGAIGILVLGVASINFVNLSTARSSSRAKEVGMRKVMGSLRGYLVRQFLVESILLSCIAVFMAIGLALLLLPSFNSLAGRELIFPWREPMFYLIVPAATVILGVIAGLYPSIFLSSFKPAQVLKGSVSLGIRGQGVRRVLVVSQFAVSIFLVVGTIVLFRQMDYIRSKNMGFTRDRLILVEETYLLGNNKSAYRDEALKNSIFTHGTISGFLPSSGPWRLPRSWWRAGEQNASTITAQDWTVDADYFKTLGMKVKAGRNFETGRAVDSAVVLVNEAALRALDLGIDPVGRELGTYRGYGPSEYRQGDLRTFTIVGIVEDFHFESMKTPIGPVIFRLSGAPRGSIVFRFEEGKTEEAVAALNTLWKKLAPGEPFTYEFMEDGFQQTYREEKKLSAIFGAFTAVSLVIACLGLFGLITYATEQRKKEVGIRKVMGASISDIVLLFSKELGKLVLIAFIIAAPLSWYTVEWWLQDYNYRVTVGPMVYLSAGLLGIIVAWLTTGFQSIRSATMNPAEVLRSE